MRVPNAGKAEGERQALIQRLEAALARFQTVPAHRREDECADEGERDCRALLAELGAPGYDRPAAGDEMQTLDEWLDDLEKR